MFEKRQQRALIEDYPLLEKKGIDEIRKVVGHFEISMAKMRSSQSLPLNQVSR